MMKAFLVSLLILAYLSTLSMSTGHLAQWYALSLGGLPPWLAWGLAASLEFTAFLLSLLSNSLLRGSAWAGGGALAALALVWLGNALSMHRAAPGVALWETLAMSLFVPVGTYVVGKVVGEMVRVSPKGATLDREGSGQAVPGGTSARKSGTAVVPRPPFAGTEEAREAVPEGAGVEPEVPVLASGGTAPVRERTTIRYQESRAMELSVEGEGRAAEVLRALSRYREPVTLTALVRDLGWPKTTVRRWLDRLEDQGLVHRTGEGWTLKEEGRYA